MPFCSVSGTWKSFRHPVPPPWDLPQRQVVTCNLTLHSKIVPEKGENGKERVCWRQIPELGALFLCCGSAPDPGHRISSPAPGHKRQNPLRKVGEGDMDVSQQSSCLKRQRKLSKYKDLAAFRIFWLRCITLSWKSECLTCPRHHFLLW